MIYPVQEGKALHTLKQLLENRTKYARIFVGQQEILLPFHVTDVLTAFRYRQFKLGEGRLQTYPTQLISLAQYYRLQSKDSHAREKIKRKLEKWLAVVCAGLAEEMEQKAEYTDMASGFLTKNFPVPLFDNDIPLEAVLSQLEFSGCAEHLAYPSYRNLIVSAYDAQSRTYTYRVAGEDAGTDVEFWKVQLWAMARCEMEKNGAEAELEAYANSRRTQAMFALSVWYANHAAAFQKEPTEKPDAQLQLIHYHINRLKNTFFEFSTDGNLSRAMGIYSRFVRRFWTSEKNTIAFLYCDPKSLREEEKAEAGRLTLPDPGMLDTGVRLFDSEIPFYGITPRMLQLLFAKPMQENARIPFCMEGVSPNVWDREVKKKLYRCCFAICPVLRFTKELPECYPDRESWKREMLKRYYDRYCGNGRKLADLRTEDEPFAEDLERCLKAYCQAEGPFGDVGKAAEEQIRKMFDQVKASRQSAVRDMMQSPAAKNAFRKLGKGESPEETEIQALSEIVKNMPLTAKQNEMWSKVIHAGKDRQKHWFSLIQSIWKSKCSDPNGIIKPWFTALPESMRMELMTGEHPDETLAALLVRSETMLILFYRQWIRCGIPVSPVVVWNSAEHFLIPEDLLKAERNILAKLFGSKDAKQ